MLPTLTLIPPPTPPKKPPPMRSLRPRLGLPKSTGRKLPNTAPPKPAATPSLRNTKRITLINLFPPSDMLDLMVGRRFIFLFAVLPLFLFSLFFTSNSFAQDSSWVVTNFQSQISIQKDGKIQIQETIAVDFKTTAKHGIFRLLPTEGIKFNFQSATQDGNKAVVQISSEAGQVSLRLGDPDVTLTGLHIYVLTYEVGKVITRF